VALSAHEKLQYRTKKKTPRNLFGSVHFEQKKRGGSVVVRDGVKEKEV